MDRDVQHVFLIGSKSLGAYGGFETFVNKLTEYHQNNEKIKYHVACKANGDGYGDESTLENVQVLSDTEFTYHNAHCFKIHVPEIGSAQAIYYDIVALNYCCRYIKENKIEHPIIYIMACRIGPVIHHYYRKIHKIGGMIYVNPDGQEWARAKWSTPIKKYWKYSEKRMVKYCDLVVCDSRTIEKYIHEKYDGKVLHGGNPNTIFIAYGTETRRSVLENDDSKLVSWYQKNNLSPKNYYLVVGRFVPENNYETMIREFKRSNSQKDFAIITNANKKFLDELENKLHFKNDNRIKFVGTVYDQELLMKIRENAFGNFHGHEVGGTNPSLLEALASTRLNLILNVEFNQEVAEDSALYWTKESGNLARLIEAADELSDVEQEEFGQKARKRIKSNYSWISISNKYEKLFIGEK